MILPGYSAQVLTFVFMIGALILIAAIVIGIFIYVLMIVTAVIGSAFSVRTIVTIDPIQAIG